MPNYAFQTPYIQAETLKGVKFTVVRSVSQFTLIGGEELNGGQGEKFFYDPCMNLIDKPKKNFKTERFKQGYMLI